MKSQLVFVLIVPFIFAPVSRATDEVGEEGKRAGWRATVTGGAENPPRYPSLTAGDKFCRAIL